MLNILCANPCSVRESLQREFAAMAGYDSIVISRIRGVVLHRIAEPPWSVLCRWYMSLYSVSLLLWPDMIHQWSALTEGAVLQRATSRPTLECYVQMVRESMQREFAAMAGHDQPYQRALYSTGMLLEASKWHVFQYLKVIADITADDLKACVRLPHALAVFF